MATATYQVTPPEPFNFGTPNEWTKWIRRLERFRSASGLEAQPEKAQVNTLIYTMGTQADDIFHSFDLTEDQKKEYETVKGKFNGHFVKRTNVIYERAMFNRRSQEEGETVNAFITALHTQAEKCAYGVLKEEMIRDRIVVGIRDATLSLKLQLDSALTLEKAVTQAREAETVKMQQPLIRQGKEKEPDTREVNAFRKGFKGKGQGRQPFENRKRFNDKTVNDKISCVRCGKTPGHEKQHCPAKEATCHKCGKRGHYKSQCKTKHIREIHKSKEFFLGAVQSKENENKQWKITLDFNGQPTEFQIDTGAEVNLISEREYKKAGAPPLSPVHQTFRGPNKYVIPVMGQFMGNSKRNDREIEQEIYVVKNLHKSLLGQPAIEALGLIKMIDQVKAAKLNPTKQFPELFTGLGKLRAEYDIKLQPEHTPYAITIPRRVPVPLRKKVKQELDRMETQGVISKITQPTEWCAGMVVAPKPNGNVRICVDLTRLNNSVRRERHPLPSVDQVLAQLAGAKIFSKLDANSGFWQIPLAEESIPLTTFMTPFGRYCFHRLPFGITSAPEHFQRRMSEMVGDMEGVVCLIDDFLIYGSNQQEHDERLTKVLTKLGKEGLTLKKKKCKFSQNQVRFLGHIIDESGIRADPEKVAAIQKIPTPTNVREVRRFLGTVNQMSKFAPNLAEINKPIRDLLVKDNQWTWGEPQQSAFDQIKEMLTTSPVLALFDPMLDTTVSADASSYGLGATLLQKQADGNLKPIGYISRSMTPTEQRYAQIEKEVLALTWASERYSEYLIGMDFHIQTDHKPLVPLFSVKPLDELPLRVQSAKIPTSNDAISLHYFSCSWKGSNSSRHVVESTSR